MSDSVRVVLKRNCTGAWWTAYLAVLPLTIIFDTEGDWHPDAGFRFWFAVTAVLAFLWMAYDQYVNTARLDDAYAIWEEPQFAAAKVVTDPVTLGNQRGAA